jgi:hypothetical protein
VHSLEDIFLIVAFMVTNEGSRCKGLRKKYRTVCSERLHGQGKRGTLEFSVGFVVYESLFMVLQLLCYFFFVPHTSSTMSVSQDIVQ